MLLDFTKLKSALRLVCKNLDHTNLNDFDYFEQNPSAERIAKYIYEQIIQLLLKEGIDISYKNQTEDAFLYAIDVFETDTSRARYIPFA
jgi:6-pyruvoyltetrahydropterin/6-carboxytetrahydropterin synthase